MSKQIVITILLFASGLFAVLQNPTLFLDPGQVTTGHSKIERDCYQCHSPLLGPSDEKCIACHKPGKIGAGKPNKAAFHQQLKEQLCVNCHTDHKGADTGKATRVFDHSLLTLTNQNSCESCHSRPQDKLHKDIAKKCDQCHGMDKWKPATLDHSRWFRFDRHHPEKCTDCHENNLFDSYTCYSCHEHSPSNVKREHLEEGIRDFQNCTACHRSGDEHEAERLWWEMRQRGISPSDFGKSPLPIDDGAQYYNRKRFRDNDHHDDDD